MKHNVFFGIAIRIVILFAVAMAATFLPEHLRVFFGDEFTGGSHSGHNSIDEEWIWGARHYWYFWMCVLLFLLATINAIIGGINIIKGNYNTSKW